MHSAMFFSSIFSEINEKELKENYETIEFATPSKISFSRKGEFVEAIQFQSKKYIISILSVDRIHSSKTSFVPN